MVLVGTTCLYGQDSNRYYFCNKNTLYVNLSKIIQFLALYRQQNIDPNITISIINRPQYFWHTPTKNMNIA